MKRCAILFSLVLFGLNSQAQAYKQYPLFVYSFTRYIQWPDGLNQGDFEILVLGDSPVIEELNVMAQTKHVGDRPIKVTKINAVNDIRKCHILFIPSTQSDKLAEALNRVSSKPILVMTEQPGLGSLGSCVNFITKDGKLAFELNQTALTKQNLKASMELIRIAIMI